MSSFKKYTLICIAHAHTHAFSICLLCVACAPTCVEYKFICIGYVSSMRFIGVDHACALHERLV